MNTKIPIQKVCEFCGEKFTAQKLSTRFCSNKCAGRNYKLVERQERAKANNQLLVDPDTGRTPLEVLLNSNQEYFDVDEAAIIMRISRRTLYRLISMKKIKKKKLLSRTIILKEDIKSFFAKQ
jgi:hypothetical protein